MPKKKKINSPIKAVSVGAAIMAAIMLAGSVITTFVISGGKTGIGAMTAAAYMSMGIGGFAGTYYVCKSVKNKKAMWAGAAILAVCVLRLVMRAFGESAVFDTDMCWSILSAAAGYALGCIPGVYKRRRRRKA